MKIRVVILVFFIIVMASCKNIIKKDMTNVVASVDGETLYNEDVIKHIPKKISFKDSIDFREKYIKNWIVQKLLLSKSKLNLPNQEYYDKLVQDYSTNLLIDAYTQRIIDKYSKDFKPTEQELKSYYIEHFQNFKLQNKLVKFRFFMTANNISKKNKYKFLKLIKSDKEEDLYQLKQYQDYYSYYQLDLNTWFTVSIISKKLGLKKSEILKKGVNIYNDQKNNRYIYVKEVLKEGQKAPYEYVKNDIKEILYHKWKIDFLKKFKENLLNKSIKKGEVIYNKK